MRKTTALIVLFISLFNVARAQYVNIPDVNLRNILRSKYPGCFNTAGQMDTSCTSITGEDSLTVQGISAASLDGIQYFKNLVYLNCSVCFNIQQLPSLPASLRYLNCNSCILLTGLPPLTHTQLVGLDCTNCNSLSTLPELPATTSFIRAYQTPLTSLPPLPAGLRYLDCTGTSLSGIFPALPDSLRTLSCAWTAGITGFSSLPPFLDTLECGTNSITSLPSLPGHLRLLNCWQNQIATLPSLPGTLEHLGCGDNQLTQLPPLPQQLKYLFCANNRLTSLPALPASLNRLDCSYNLLDSLPALPLQLYELGCSYNAITHLPVLPASLLILQCNNNRLSGLPALPDIMSRLACNNNNIYCLPQLPRKGALQESIAYRVFELCIDTAKIKCLPNYTMANRFSIFNGYATYPSESVFVPLCSPVNNIHQCHASPVMSGKIFFDYNNNGIKDIVEHDAPHVKVNSSNGAFTFTNSNGYFEIGADSPGSYTVSIEAPGYFSAVPVSATYNFTSYDTIVTNNYALHADIIIDSLTIKITPLMNIARPGSSYPYIISYENSGTTSLTTSIVFDYDEAKLSYNTSSVAGVVDNTHILSFNPGTLAPGETGSFIGYFTVKTTALMNEPLFAEAIFSSNIFTAYDSVKTVIRYSFDPNDKQATPQLSPLQLANGEYIDYTIRFQNTGTDTAFTIVISDTLSSDLQGGTLQMTAASHNCKATVKDNIVFFEFLNILLPDSNVNEPMSHGFVSFRIKPLTTISVNSTITNKAAIYFDYNAPVITNMAGTLIKEFTPVPLRLISFSAVPQNDNTTALYWNTANEINTKQFVIERGNDGLHFTSLANIIARGRASNNYFTSVTDINTGILFYRLKMVDNDGSFTYSPVIRIDRRKNTAGVSILSNPVKDILIVNTTDRTLNNTPANIFNVQGAVVKTFIIKEGSQSVDIKELPAGIYYLRAKTGVNRIFVQ